ncbi:MAG: SPFH domain-containing protein [Victivallales bacterium]|nr:SPFH domain-containing protein [Victivallales bacterium]
MGLFKKLRNEFIDIIEWEESAANVLVHRFERYNNEIKHGAKLVVRPGQRAVFVNEGRIADAFDPGTYTLETKNLPILRTLLSWPYAFESPFKAEVYFIKTTEQLDRKWGTPNPVMLRDADFGIVRLRCRGNYSYCVGISEEMISRFVGARDEFTNDDVEGQIRTKVVSSFSDAVAELKIPALDLAAQYDEISTQMKTKLEPEFAALGMELKSFTLENISLPDTVQQAMDERASMGALGDLNNYSQYQAANAIRDAAQNQGGAGNMMGMMMGGQLAGNTGQTLFRENQQQNNPPSGGATPPPIPGEIKFWAAINGTQAGPFNINELKAKASAGEINRDTLVWKDGMANWLAAGEVPEIQQIFGATPPPLPGS